MDTTRYLVDPDLLPLIDQMPPLVLTREILTLLRQAAPAG